MTDLIPEDLLERAAERWPNRPALKLGSEQLTYAELNKAVDLHAARVEHGRTVPVVASMTRRAVVALWGIPRAGAVALPLDPQSGPATTPAVPASMCPRAGDASAEAAYILATSGSTGAPRGVIVTAANIEAATAASTAYLDTTTGDCWLLTVPLHHVAGLAVLWRAARDGSAVILHGGFGAAAVDHALGGGITWVSLVPTMLRRLLVDAGGPWPGVRGALVGGTHVDDELVARARRRGLMVLPTYGMTETCAQAATVHPKDDHAIGTVGRPLPGVEIAIEGTDSANVEGRILIDGPTVSPGYVGEKPRSGPLRTNDVGFFDAAGRLSVVGRMDDVVISGGENVNPADVEAALVALPEVDDAVVFGVPDLEWGERVVGIVAGAADLLPAALLAAVSEVLPPHAVPKELRVVARLPRLASGKVDRVTARRRLTES